MSTTGSFVIDPESLSNLAAKIDSYNSSLESMKANFDSTFDALTTAPTWVGTDADAFRGKREEMSADIAGMINCINDIVADFNQTSDSYTDEEAAETAYINNSI